MLASGSAVPADCRLNPKPPGAPAAKAIPNIEVLNIIFLILFMDNFLLCG